MRTQNKNLPDITIGFLILACWLNPLLANGQNSDQANSAIHDLSYVENPKGNAVPTHRNANPTARETAPGISSLVKSSALTNTLPILNNRAFLTFPEEAVNTPRPSLSANEFNADYETRIIIDLEDIRIVFFAEELFILDEENIFSQLLENSPHSLYRAKNLKENSEQSAILLTPVSYDSTESAILINTLLVKNSDNIVFKMEVYINNSAFKHRAELTKLTEEIFETIDLGTRFHNQSDKVELISLYQSSQQIKVSLPQNYGLSNLVINGTHQAISIHKYTELNDYSKSSMMIYVGTDLENIVYESYLDSSSVAKQVSGTFLNQPMVWLEFSDTNENRYIKEEFISLTIDGKKIYIRLIMESNDPQILDELIEISSLFEIIN